MPKTSVAEWADNSSVVTTVEFKASISSSSCSLNVTSVVTTVEFKAVQVTLTEYVMNTSVVTTVEFKGRINAPGFFDDPVLQLLLQ